MRSIPIEKAMDVEGSGVAACTHGGGAGEGGGILAPGGAPGAAGGGTIGDGGLGGAGVKLASGGGDARPTSSGDAVRSVTALLPEAHEGAPFVS